MITPPASESLIASLSAPLREKFLADWSDLQEVAGQQKVEHWLSQYPDCLSDLPRVWMCSRYVVESCIREPDLLDELLGSGDLQRTYPPDEFEKRLTAAIAGCDDEAALMAILRQFRRREMLRIIWRDLASKAEFSGTVAELSSLADASIDTALRWQQPRLERKFGQPIGDSSGQTQSLVVLGMGKLGAMELNLSSDIDLIFAYPEAGETNGEKVIGNQEFFTRLGRDLIKILDTRTSDGFVFRVDMRLRPYGDSGALVFSFDAMEEYYQNQGRDWERYAMIKARPCAGDTRHGADLLAMLRPFTYRRYLDYSAIESLRQMKAMINSEVKRRGKGQDLKLGAGGIREIEFIAQSFQLIRGGRERELQDPGLLSTLDRLQALELMPAKAVEDLKEAYIFLRKSEHALQAWNDEQTQRLPSEPLALERLALSQGYSLVDDYQSELQRHRANVRGHFSELIRSEGDDSGTTDQALNDWQVLWEGSLDDEASLELLVEAGFMQPQASLAQLKSLRDGPKAKVMQSLGRERLDSFMPKFLAAQCETSLPSISLERSLPLIEAVMRRSAYLLLLEENPKALQQLLALCSASVMVARQLARHPSLLDELLDSRRLYTLPDRAALRSELQVHMLRSDVMHLEEQMDELRYFRLQQVLRIAACELTGVLPLMKVSDYLTYLAEAILEHALAISRAQIVHKHGRPRDANGLSSEDDFLVVAYGKMGGLEMSHGSDLDLVFLHDAGAGQSTDGDRSIDAEQFFTRVCQRMIHVLNTTTSQGQLYEVDVRLRPSGASGLLVASMSAFHSYQSNDAWTWEHQALVRARAVAGSDKLSRQFDEVRREVLSKRRDPQQLAAEVFEMRAKMQTHLLPTDTVSMEQFHLKQSPGGIVDIEFMVQYAVLVWSCDYPELTVFSDNIRILESLRDCGLIDGSDATTLIDAYKVYRTAQHRLALEEAPDWVPESEVAETRDAVLRCWPKVFGTERFTAEQVDQQGTQRTS